MVKNPPASKIPRFDPRVWKLSQRRKWQPTPVFLPWESHGQRSPVHGVAELDTEILNP